MVTNKKRLLTVSNDNIEILQQHDSSRMDYCIVKDDIKKKKFRRYNNEDEIVYIFELPLECLFNILKYLNTNSIIQLSNVNIYLYNSIQCSPISSYFWRIIKKYENNDNNNISNNQNQYQQEQIPNKLKTDIDHLIIKTNSKLSIN